MAYTFWVGVDWATTAHQIAVVDTEGRVIDERAVVHSGPALESWGQWLMHLAQGDPSRVAVGIEVPRGPVVELLVERGFHVYAINPKQLDRFRDRYTVAGAKDDRRDALVLATSLRTDVAAFRRISLDDPLIVQLRELSRVEEDVKQDLSRLTNRLREQLHRFYPQLLTLCPGADEPWLWALLEQAPTPAAGQRLRRPAVSKLLRAYRIRRVRTETVVGQLRTPAPYVAPGTVEAASTHIALLLPRLTLLHAQQGACARQIDRLLETLAETPEGRPEEHRDVTILRSLPGVGRVVVATMLAEAVRPLAERDYHALRAQTGSAPITRQSGKRCVVSMRYACNQRLRQAVYHWGRVSVQCDPRSRAHYDRLRGRGHTHARAVRGVVDRLLGVMVAMLRDRTLYDASRRLEFAA
jgi:transposase